MAKNSNHIRTVYDRIAPSYDSWDAIPERLLYSSWRRRLWNGVGAGRILEIGVGTGKNIPFYPPGGQVTAIDISPRMLEGAAKRAATRTDVGIELLRMDASELALDAAVFDTVIGSFALMVVPEPLKALQEVRRVCKPDGKLLLLEFAHSRNQLVAFVQGLVTPLTRAIYCAHVDRDISALVESSGFRIAAVEKVADGVVEIIRAAPAR
jgi:ubiquinone/menaquinone biosynthesis C-methylase UbiE